MPTQDRYRSMIDTILGELQQAEEFGSQGTLPVAAWGGGALNEVDEEEFAHLGLGQLPFIHVAAGPAGTTVQPIAVQEDLWIAELTISVVVAPPRDGPTILYAGAVPNKQLPRGADARSSHELLGYLSRAEEIMALIPLHNPNFGIAAAQGRPDIQRINGELLRMPAGLAGVLTYWIGLRFTLRLGIDYDY